MVIVLIAVEREKIDIPDGGHSILPARQDWTSNQPSNIISLVYRKVGTTYSRDCRTFWMPDNEI